MPTPTVLPGAPPQAGSGAWGMVPNVPDPTSSAALAISGDIANLPGLQTLAGQTNAFNTQQALAPYIANLPGYQDMVAQSSKNIGGLLQGQIPADVMALLAQSSAERGAASGMPDAPASNAAYLRSLGLTSLGLEQQGEQNLTQAIQRTPVPQLFNTAQFMTTPTDMQAAAMAANMYAAAPNPAMNAQALIDLFTRMMGSGGGVRGGVQTSPGGGGGSPYQFPSGAGVGGGGGSPGYTPFPGGGAFPIQSQPGQGPNIGGPLGFANLGNIGGTTGTGFPAYGTGSAGPANPFGSPSYSDTSVLGAGLNPLLNAALGQGGYYDFMTGGTTGYQTPGITGFEAATGFSPEELQALGIDPNNLSGGGIYIGPGGQAAPLNEAPLNLSGGLYVGPSGTPSGYDQSVYDWTGFTPQELAGYGAGDYSGAITNDFSFLGPADTLPPEPSYGGYTGYNYGGGYNYSTGYGG